MTRCFNSKNRFPVLCHGKPHVVRQRHPTRTVRKASNLQSTVRRIDALKLATMVFFDVEERWYDDTIRKLAAGETLLGFLTFAYWTELDENLKIKQGVKMSNMLKFGQSFGLGAE
jgi:hypothetical protein